MNASEPTRAISWPGDPATLTAEAVDFEALAHVLGNTCCWGGRSRRFYSLAQHAVTVCDAVGRLGGMNEEARRILSLHALLADARRAWVAGLAPAGLLPAELPPAGPGRAAEQARRGAAAVQRAVLEAAGLEEPLSEDWAEALRFVQRMAEGAVCRDLPEAAIGRENQGGAGPLFPPLKERIRPIGPDRAARRWLERFKELCVESPRVPEGSSAQPNQEAGHVTDA